MVPSEAGPSRLAPPSFEVLRVEEAVSVGVNASASVTSPGLDTRPKNLMQHMTFINSSVSVPIHAATPPASPPASIAGDSAPASPLIPALARSPSPTPASNAPSTVNGSSMGGFQPLIIPTPLASPVTSQESLETPAASPQPQPHGGQAPQPLPLSLPQLQLQLPSPPAGSSRSHIPPDQQPPFPCNPPVNSAHVPRPIHVPHEEVLHNPRGNPGIKKLAGRFIIVEKDEGTNLQRCIEVETSKEYAIKAVENGAGHHSMLSAHYRVDGHAYINPVKEVVVGSDRTYLIFPPSTTDLHSYVRTRRRLKEPQARQLFTQIVSAVHEAHKKGIVLRDLKLRKFVFPTESRMHLRLESLEDAVVLEDESDDLLSDKHGCPAYVSPEILRCNTQYSGRAADMWGLGVMLYTMMVGRYPFHGQEHSGLFAKIRRGQFTLPDSLSSRAKCLIRCLLRKDPSERLSTEDVLLHPWITQLSAREKATATASVCTSSSSARRALQEYGLDQTVPALPRKKGVKSRSGNTFDPEGKY